jgi:CTP:molybdopterin cytidylyltransferase MocA
VKPDPGTDAGTDPGRAPVGLLLAAGAGTRYGRPKATVFDADGTGWLARSVASLREGGCPRVVVVLGAGAEEARALVARAGAEHVVAADWAAGLGASLAAGLEAVAGLEADSAVVTLVDLPDVGAEVVRRVLAGSGSGAEALARATYAGRPGHPVVLGRAHWDRVRAGLAGDRGAGPYLVDHDALRIECGDLASGIDVDVPAR